MNKNPLLKIQELGQSIWLDFIRRSMLTSGELNELIADDGLRGVTSNPAIFEKAIAGSNDYLAAIRSLVLEGKTSDEVYQALAVEDVQQAADDFRGVFDSTDGRDGFVSLEVSPYLARDTQGTIEEARRLWAALDRPNVFIKVPATVEGLPAIEQLISEGINVNVTLLFGLDRYRAVADAYTKGLERRATAGLPIDRVASVASFFLSRIDLLVDPLLEKAMKEGGKTSEIAGCLHGEAAIASAKIAYQIYKEMFSSKRFWDLAGKGARTQRVLWASTSTKNPAYSDIKYVEALIGRETVNTLPMETLNAYRDHGDPALRLEEGVEEAREVLRLLPEVGVDLKAITDQLEEEGIEKFSKPFDRLLNALEEKREQALAEPVDPQEIRLGGYGSKVVQRVSDLETSSFGKRFWRKDPTLWKAEGAACKLISGSLGWLHVAEKMAAIVPYLQEFAYGIKDAGFRHVVHMGMGGSSLAPLVLQQSFPVGKDGLQLTVLDTTDPATILKIERELPIAETLFIVATKSGTTAEPLAFGDYFYQKVKSFKRELAGDNFVAITDPGTPLVDLARDRKFRHTFLNFDDIGGRYSALSYFGMTPAALMGIDIGELLERALRMAHACASTVPAQENPGLMLGSVIGESAFEGRDKLTFVAPESLCALEMWLEQLLAESTGKEGSGILPVAGEDLGEPGCYGPDRVFVLIKVQHQPETPNEEKLGKLAAQGMPLVTIRLNDLMDLGQEFFRWEVATAVAGSVLGINAFDQPNVQESKDNTNRLLKLLQQEGRLPEEKPTVLEAPLRIYGGTSSGDGKSLFAEFFGSAQPGDYIGIQAYLTEDSDTHKALQAIRLLLRDRLRLASTLGYGPRFLHSTGQYHKGGPNKGFFIQLTAVDVEDAAIPGKAFTFGLLKKAQALGDLEALRKHKRRVVRVDLGNDVRHGLASLTDILSSAV
jgi:transaldolase / glucose-6-phosphate isomerase